MTTKQKNARFWVWADGWVKLTLKPGQSLEHATGGSCEEGWSFQATTWEYDGERVERSYSSEARDCDGRHGHYANDSCHVDQLSANDAYHDPDEPALPFMTPAWEDAKASQYDQYAELAGY